MLEPDRAADAGGRVAEHRRFSLRDVTLAGVPVGGATIDVWRDGGGVARWSARLLVPAARPVDHGELAGRTGDGRVLSGPVRLGEVRAGPRGGRQVLAEFHGVGPLVESPAAEPAGS